MRSPILLCFSALGLSFLVSPAFAVDKIYSPNLVKGEIELEYSGNWAQSKNPLKKGASGHEFELEYTPTDHFKLELEGVYEREPNDKLRFEARELGFVYQPMATGEAWADVAMQVIYVLPEDRHAPQALEAKLLVEKQTGPWLHRLNLGLEQEIGPNHGPQPERFALWSTRYLYKPQFNPGFEYQAFYGTPTEGRGFSKQEHYFGPSAYGKLGTHWKYEAGYLVGLSKPTASGVLRLMLEYERYF